MGRRLTVVAAFAALALGCGDYESEEPWTRGDDADTDAGPDEFEVEPLDDEPGGGDDAQLRPQEPSPRSCEADQWARGWEPAANAPVLETHVDWESVGIRPSQFVQQDGQTTAWYVGQTLEHCVVGNWAATCLVGRVGRADKTGESWTFVDQENPTMDLWHWGLSVRRLFVRAPDTSSARQWDAWLALEGIDVNSEIYWASSEDGERWTVRVSEPALAAGVGTWDSAGVSDPQVWTRDGKTSMLYTGFEGEFDRPQIGLAHLTDQGWVRASDRPILPHGESGEHDAWGVLRPSVLIFEDCLVMYHQAIDDVGNSTLSVATSTDGRSWSRASAPVDAGQGILDWHDAGEYDPVVFMDGDSVNLLFNGAAEAGTGGVGWLSLR